MCLTKLLLWSLKKRFNKLSRAEKEQVRKLANEETKSDTTEKQKKQRKRRTIKMAEEIKAEAEEVKKEETSTQPKEEGKVEETKTEEKVIDEAKPEAQPEQVEVQQTEPTGNGVRVEDLVTKDELADRLAAFEAKFEALTKENVDLKNELSQAKEQLAGMKDKYETSDFGDEQKQGIQAKDKSANDTFAEYAKQFI